VKGVKANALFSGAPLAFNNFGARDTSNSWCLFALPRVVAVSAARLSTPASSAVFPSDAASSGKMLSNNSGRWILWNTRVAAARL